MNEQMFPSEVIVEVAGETFTLKAFKAKNMRPYIRITKSMHDKAVALGKELGKAYAIAKEAGDEAEELSEANLPLDLLHERCYEEYVELVCVATGKPIEWVEELGIDELLALASIINELNAKRYTPKKDEARVMVKGVQ